MNWTDAELNYWRARHDSGDRPPLKVGDWVQIEGRVRGPNSPKYVVGLIYRNSGFHWSIAAEDDTYTLRADYRDKAVLLPVVKQPTTAPETTDVQEDETFKKDEQAENW